MTRESLPNHASAHDDPCSMVSLLPDSHASDLAEPGPKIYSLPPCPSSTNQQTCRPFSPTICLRPSIDRPSCPRIPFCPNSAPPCPICHPSFGPRRPSCPSSAPSCPSSAPSCPC